METKGKQFKDSYDYTEQRRLYRIDKVGCEQVKVWSIVVGNTRPPTCMGTDRSLCSHQENRHFVNQVADHQARLQTCWLNAFLHEEFPKLL